MARRKTKPKTEDENGADTSNDIDEIEAVSKTVVEPTEVVNNDVLLSRSESRYVPPLR